MTLLKITKMSKDLKMTSEYSHTPTDLNMRNRVSGVQDTCLFDTCFISIWVYVYALFIV